MISSVSAKLKEKTIVLDTELLLKVSLESGLLRRNIYAGTNILDNYKVIVFNIAKSIFKNKYPTSIVRKNNAGMSVSITNAKLVAIHEFKTRISRQITNRNLLTGEISQFLNYNNETLPHSSCLNVSINEENGKILVYINFETRGFYSDNLVYKQVFKAIQLISCYEKYYDKMSSMNETIQELIEQENQRIQRELEESIRLRRELEHAEQQNRERNEMLNRGATPNGVDIARRLAEVLGNRTN